METTPAPALLGRNTDPDDLQWDHGMKYVLAICLLAFGVSYVAAAEATASAPPPVKSLIFGDEFNGAAGTQPGHKVWGAKHFSNWSGWTHIAENGSGSILLTAYKDSNG